YGNISEVTGKTRHDHSLNIEVGLTLNIGKSKWKKEPDVQGIQEMYQMEIDALKATIEDLENNND
ncbi:MAG: OmpA family protein, partial [Prevotella sp.]|nr:OmpA family protein [Prevotella sp.]